MDLLWVFCLSQIKECPEDMSRNDRNDQNYTLECRVKSIRWLFLHWIVLFFDEKRGKSILEFNSFFKKFVNEYCMYFCSIDRSCRYPIRNRCFHHHYRKNLFSSMMSTLLLPVRLSVFFSSLPLSSIYYLSKKKEKIHIIFTSKILF